ncbi:double-CXXCG motif protein [Myxococcus virescens]
MHCPTCDAIWSDVGHDYRCDDLSHLSKRAMFEQPRLEPFSDFVRFREGP